MGALIIIIKVIQVCFTDMADSSMLLRILHISLPSLPINVLFLKSFLQSTKIKPMQLETFHFIFKLAIKVTLFSKHPVWKNIGHFI